jgi:hypothetical protein
MITDYLTTDLHEVFAHYNDPPVTGEAWALEVQVGRPGRKFWSTVHIAHQSSVYRTLAEAKRKRSYLRQFDRRTWGEARESRIVKITITREIVA